mgnify:CR=1 FL=1
MKIKIKPFLAAILFTIAINTWTMSEEDQSELEEVDLRRDSEVRYNRLAADQKKRKRCCGALLASCLPKKKQRTSSFHEKEEEVGLPAPGEWISNQYSTTYTPPANIEKFEEWELPELIQRAIEERFYRNEGERTHQTQEALKKNIVELLKSRQEGWN